MARNPKRRSLPRRLVRWLLGALVVWLLVSAACIGAMRFIDPPTSAFMVQRRIEARGEGREAFVLHHEWVPLGELPPALGLAVISSEDQRFVLHHGFDLQAIRHAVGERLLGRDLRGASTLSQQVAKNLFLWEGRSLLRKGLEVYFTLGIELMWPKQRILEVYLNIAELGDGVFGVAAGARHHFDSDVRMLSDARAALLVTALPSPRTVDLRRPTARLLHKQRWILGQMERLPATLTQTLDLGLPTRTAAR